MPKIMLRPNHPSGVFRRTVETGKGMRKTLVFRDRDPVDVTDDQYLALGDEIGVILFDVEVDAKGRPRYVEPVT